MLPLMSNNKIRFKDSSPWANAMIDCGCPSSVTVKSPLVRLLIKSWPCSARTSTRTSATPVLKVGVSELCAPRGVRMKSVEMKNIIIGTAGHIDHGKTALVGALTGIDTDRLKEEKQRGISIDLGFAHLAISQNVLLGFVDVPGHERFIKNMLAGVGGIDLVLFVIAADESIKPQTREHFDICRLLGIRNGIVVLTKSDLVDPDVAGLVRLETEEFLCGSFLGNAPIVPVSARTGAGIAQLKQELLRVAAEVPGKDAARYFRLPIDRAFAIKGFGTVVTGTLVSGTVGREDEVELFPASGRLRVRGVQSGGK